MALLIGIGYAVAKWGVVTLSGAQDLTRLTFNVLAPALLFHTMSQVHLQELNIAPVALYFVVALSLFFLCIGVLGFSRTSTVLGLAGTYSNTTMIGVPLIGLVYGAAGLVFLFTLISVHAIILLTTATVALELSLLKEGSQDATLELRGSLSPWVTILRALRNATIHPVPLPIIGGMIFAHFGWKLPELIEQPVVWVGQAFSPLALMLVGISLYSAIKEQAQLSISSKSVHVQRADERQANTSQLISVWQVATVLTFVKNIVNPLLVLFIGHWVGIQGLALSVMVLAASMPIGANVFLFSQRYSVCQREITIAVSASTLAAMASVPFVIWLMQFIN